MLEMRVIPGEEVKKRFSEKQIKGIEKRKLLIPKIIELESENWIARYYDTRNSIYGLKRNWGDQVIDIKDKKTGFKITKFVSDLGGTYPLCKLIEAPGCELYKDATYFTSVDPKILEETIDNIWKDLTMKNVKLTRYNGIVLRVGDDPI